MSQQESPTRPDRYRGELQRKCLRALASAAWLTVKELVGALEQYRIHDELFHLTSVRQQVKRLDAMGWLESRERSKKLCSTRRPREYRVTRAQRTLAKEQTN